MPAAGGDSRGSRSAYGPVGVSPRAVLAGALRALARCAGASARRPAAVPVRPPPPRPYARQTGSSSSGRPGADRADKVAARDDADVELRARTLGDRRLPAGRGRARASRPRPPRRRARSRPGGGRRRTATATVGSDAVPNDPLFGQLWGLQQHAAPGSTASPAPSPATTSTPSPPGTARVGAPVDRRRRHRQRLPLRRIPTSARSPGPTRARSPATALDDDGNGYRRRRPRLRLRRRQRRLAQRTTPTRPTTTWSPAATASTRRGRSAPPATTASASPASPATPGSCRCGSAPTQPVLERHRAARSRSIVAAINYAGANGRPGGEHVARRHHASAQTEVNAIAAHPETLFVISAGNDGGDNDGGGAAPQGHHYPCDYRADARRLAGGARGDRQRRLRRRHRPGRRARRLLRLRRRLGRPRRAGNAQMLSTYPTIDNRDRRRLRGRRLRRRMAADRGGLRRHRRRRRPADLVRDDRLRRARRRKPNPIYGVDSRQTAIGAPRRDRRLPDQGDCGYRKRRARLLYGLFLDGSSSAASGIPRRRNRGQRDGLLPDGADRSASAATRCRSVLRLRRRLDADRRQRASGSTTCGSNATRRSPPTSATRSSTAPRWRRRTSPGRPPCSSR